MKSKEGFVIKGTILLTVATFIFAIAGYVINIWLGRNLGPEVYGLYGIVIAVWTFVNLIIVSGIPSAVTKHISADEKQRDSILKTSIGLLITFSIIISSAYYSMAPILGAIFNDSRLVPYFRLSAFIIPIYSLHAIYVSYYNGLRDFVRQSLIASIYPIAKVAFVIGLAKIYGVAGAILGFIAAPFFTLFFSFKLPKQSAPPFPLKKLIFFSVPIIGYTLFFTLMQQIDLYFVKILMDNPQAAGFYTAGQSISVIPLYIFGAVSSVIFPSISKSVNDNNDVKIGNMIRYAIRLVAIVLIPLAVLISTTSVSLVKLIFTSRYQVSAEPLSILIFGYCFLAIFSICSNVLNGAGQPKKTFLSATTGILISAICSYILIPIYGLAGAALSTTIAAGFSLIVSMIFIKNRFRTTLPIKSIIRIAAATVGIFFIARSFDAQGVWLLVLYAVIAVLYLAVLFISGEFTEEDYSLVRENIPLWMKKK